MQDELNSVRPSISDFCKLCLLKPQKQLSELITPCGCGYHAHRECIKKYLIQKRISKCPYCSNDFLVGYTLGPRITCIHKSILEKCVMIFAVTLIIGIALVLGISTVFTFIHKHFRQRMFVWEIVTVVFMGVTLLLLLTFMFIAIYSYCIRKEIVDIEIYCSKTEIAKGMEDPQKTLKRHFEWLRLGGYYDELRQEFPELKSLLRKNKKKAPSPIIKKERAVLVPGSIAEDPNEAVIYSSNNIGKRLVVPYEENKEGMKDPVNTSEIIDLSRHEDIIDRRMILREEISAIPAKNKETETVLSAAEEIKPGDINVANHIMAIRNSVGKAAGDIVEDNINTTERK